MQSCLLANFVDVHVNITVVVFGQACAEQSPGTMITMNCADVNVIVVVTTIVITHIVTVVMIMTAFTNI